MATPFMLEQKQYHPDFYGRGSPIWVRHNNGSLKRVLFSKVDPYKRTIEVQTLKGVLEVLSIDDHRFYLDRQVTLSVLKR